MFQEIGKVETNVHLSSVRDLRRKWYLTLTLENGECIEGEKED